MKQAGFGVAGASGLVASVFLTLKARGGGGEGAQRAGEILHVVACGHVVGVAGFQLVVQALHQLILCSGCDYLHASLHVAQHSFLLVRRRTV